MSTDIIDLTTDPSPIRPPTKKLKRDDGEDELERITKACPIMVNGRDGGSGLIQEMEEHVDLCLSVGWEKAKSDEDMLDECKKFLDPEQKAYHAGVEKEDIDQEAALKAMAEDEEENSTGNVFQFTKEGEDAHDGKHWYVSCQKKKTLTNAEATDAIKRMFKGYCCIYPEGYDNFGKTPFGDSDPDDDAENNKKFTTTPFSKLHESVLYILQKAKSVEHSMWDGLCQNEECDALIEREECFFFDIMEDDGNKKFLFQFKWKYQCG